MNDPEKFSSSSDGSVTQAEGQKHFHGQYGRLVVDPIEAKKEFGEEAASKLKKTPDNKWVCWPQPTDDPDDPLNWSEWRKNRMLAIYCFAGFVPDFSSALGIPSLFPLAKEFHTTTDEINDLTSNWSIFLLAWGGIIAVVLISMFGRLPVLFWSQLGGTAFLIGCAVAPNLATFAGMRCLQAIFSTSPQITGLYAIKDVFFFHQEARKLGIWTTSVLLSPFTSPFIGNFMVGAGVSWRWVYGMGCIYQGLVLLLVTFFGEETMYDRHLNPVPKPKSTGLRLRLETLVGITGVKLQKYRMSLGKALMQPLRVFIRPNMILMSLYLALTFAWNIGINVTLIVFLQSPPPLGREFTPEDVSKVYLSPLISLGIGEILGYYLNDFITFWYIKRHNGVFEPEARLPLAYMGSVLMFSGQILVGGTLERHLSIAGIVVGWGMYIVGVSLAVNVIYSYGSDCFPTRQGEVSALLNLWRVMLGFAVAFWEVPFAIKKGPLLEFSTQSTIIAGATLLIPLLQWKGKTLRHSMKEIDY